MKKASVLLIAALALILLPAYAAAACGDGTCDTGENACNCSADCGSCSGEVPEKPCKEYACSGGFCRISTVLNCCPNALCESGEDYGSCPADCMPAEVTIEMVEPVAGTKYLRGDTVPFKIRVTADDRPIASADVNAEGFFGFVQMYNDGRHNDDKFSDNIYGNTLILGSDAPEGVHPVEIDANFIGITDQEFIDLEVYPRLDHTFALNPEYTLGDIIEITGTINRRDTPVASALDVNITVDGVKVFGAKANSDRDGHFSVAYHTTLLDPLGVWHITVFGRDEYNNYVLAETDAKFGMPQAVHPLTIEPIGEFTGDYERGSELTFVAKIRDEFDNLIEGATAEVTTPIGERIALSELQPGQYTASYPIEYSTPLGLQHYRMIATYDSEGRAYRGSMNFDIKIEKTALNITFLEPTKRHFKVGETIRVEIELTYPDGRFVKDATVQGLFAGKPIAFSPLAAGVFEGSYTFSEEDAGSNKVFIKVEDSYGNVGLKDKSLEVAGKTLLYQVQANLHIIVPAIAAILVVSAAVGKVYYRRLRLRRLKNRRHELIELEKELQRNYFEAATVTKKEYKELMDRYEAELKRVETNLDGMQKKNQ